MSDRAAEFAALAARAESPSYRRFWESQAAHYKAKDELRIKNYEAVNSQVPRRQRVRVGSAL
jgi:hypothetical protein